MQPLWQFTPHVEHWKPCKENKDIFYLYQTRHNDKKLLLERPIWKIHKIPSVLAYPLSTPSTPAFQSKCSDLLSHSPESLIAEVTLGGTLVSLLSKLVRLAGFLDLRSNCAGTELLQHPDAILVEVQAAGRTTQALRNRDKIEREL